MERSTTAVCCALCAVLFGPAGCQSPLPNLSDAHRDLSGSLPVFPGAEGFGTDTPAGRGGALLVVTNLDSSGPGSLREALDAGGARVVVFQVGGTIWLDDDIDVTEPFLTLAGQTAPSPGITIAGAGLVIRTHDVLVQHIRIRPGDRASGPDPEGRDGLEVFGDSDGDGDTWGVVIDHCSISWGVDENAATWYPGLRDVTWSNNIIAEGLHDSLHPEGPHSKGLLIGDHSRRVAVLRNLFAHNYDRSPVMKQDTSTLVINNLIYNPGNYAIVMYGSTRCCPALATIEANVVIAGEDTREWTPAVHLNDLVHEDTRAYVFGNTFEGMSAERRSDVGGQVWAPEPPVSVAPSTLLDVGEVEEQVLLHAGARPADRDAVDLRIVASVRERTGTLVDRTSDVGGWPEVAMTHVELDLPADPQGDDDDDGYTNLEEWLHACAAEVEGR